MQAISFDTLRAMVLHYSALRGWRTQRHIAVICGLDEAALSRFLSGEQDIGARRTHALFQTVGIPPERYDYAYALLGQAQELASRNRQARTVARTLGARPRASVQALDGQASTGRGGAHTAGWPDLLDDIPAAVLVALFAARMYSGEQIAAFFAGAA